ncbi:MAG: thiol reductant ABC exporter subunit CydD [Caulobacter sp.]|nr:thiol reductant ABC exporter subunit CydD [Caulobacter sp.]
MALVSPLPDDLKAARAWLGGLSRAHARPLRRSGLFLLLDVLAAIGFAGGLAMGLSRLDDGLAAAAPWLALAAGSGALRGLLAKASTMAAARAAVTVKDAVRRDAAARLLNEPPGGRTTGGELMAGVVEGVEALDGYFARFMPARTASTIGPFLVIIAVAFASPVSAAILLGTLLPFAAGMALAGMAAAEESRKQFQALSRLSGLFLDRVRGLPLILAFQADASQTQALQVRADDLASRTIRVLRAAFVSSAVLEFFAALSVALVAVYCGFNLLRLLPFPVPEALDLPRAFFALALAPEVYAPLRRLAAAYHDRQAAEAVAPALDRPAPARATPAAIARPDTAPALRFEAVTVHYPEASTPVFTGFDLAIAPGECMAIMGASGTGKSTLLNLLLGLAPLGDGEVWMDDAPLSAAGSFASAIAWAGQAPLVVPGTLAQNVALARQDATPAEIAAVCERVGLAGALGMREAGLDARIDERGGGLSGGERRRLALARALLKDAPVLLLDEPTANLDDASARALLPVIAQAAKGRTTLIVTHGEEVARLADRVVRL